MSLRLHPMKIRERVCREVLRGTPLSPAVQAVPEAERALTANLGQSPVSPEDRVCQSSPQRINLLRWNLREDLAGSGPPRPRVMLGSFDGAVGAVEGLRERPGLPASCLQWAEPRSGEDPIVNFLRMFLVQSQLPRQAPSASGSGPRPQILHPSWLRGQKLP